MRKKSVSLILFLITVCFLIVNLSFVSSYDGTLRDDADSSNCGTTLKSKPNGKKSHFFGLNCSACHAEGRKGKGCFTIAGSVLNEERSNIFKNPVVKLYTKPESKGELVATIKGDAFGNFYTTEIIDFGDGLYPTLIGSPDAAEPIKHMMRPVYSFNGQCNKCHGYKKDEEALGID